MQLSGRYDVVRRFGVLVRAPCFDDPTWENLMPRLRVAAFCFVAFLVLIGFPGRALAASVPGGLIDGAQRVGTVSISVGDRVLNTTARHRAYDPRAGWTIDRGMVVRAVPAESRRRRADVDVRRASGGRGRPDRAGGDVGVGVRRRGRARLDLPQRADGCAVDVRPRDVDRCERGGGRLCRCGGSAGRSNCACRQESSRKRRTRRCWTRW